MKERQLEQICNSFMDETMEYNDLPGLIIGVRAGGERFTGARGVRDVTGREPLQAGDVFHCASVSKLFTSSAVLQLAEAGALALDQPLSEILPELSIADKRWEGIRLCQMLSHTSGLGDVDDYHWEQALTSDTALSEYVHSEEVADLPLLWEPGEGGFRYSNIAYEILGHIVAVKSGMSYEEYVRRNLMEPAGMTDSTMLTFERIGVKAGETCPLITEEIRRRNADGNAGLKAEDADGSPGAEKNTWHPMALPHEKAEDRSIRPVRYYPYTRSHGPSSTLTSTAEDLLKWADVHMAGFASAAGQGEASAAGQEEARRPEAILSPGTYRQICREYAEVPNNREKMGLGWFMRRQEGCLLYGHEGTDDGFRASLWMCPERQTAIAVLSNLSGAPVKKISKKLFKLLADQRS